MTTLLETLNNDSGIAFQEWLEERPQRWLPDYVRYPMATVRGLYKHYIAPAVSGPRAIKEVKEEKPLMSTRKKRNNGGKGSGGGKKWVQGKKKQQQPKKGKKKKVEFLTTASKTNKRQLKNLEKTLGNRLNSIAEVTKTGSIARFGSGRMHGSMLMSGRQRLGQVKSVNIDGTLSVAIVFDATGRSDTIFPLNPTMAAYVGTPLTNLAVCFQNFLWVKCEMQYKTRSATNDNGAIVMAYFPDVGYLEGVGYAGTTPLVSESDLVKSSYTTTIPFYRDYNFRMPILQNRSAPRYYTRNEYTGTTGGYVLDVKGDTPGDRQDYQGMFVVSGNTGGTSSSGFLWGDIYMNYTIELGDLAEPATTATPTTALSRLSRQLQQLGVEIPSPPVQIEPVVPKVEGKLERKVK